MQLSEKYKENFDVSSEGPSSGVTSGGPPQTKGLRSEHQNSPYFPVVASLPTKACSYYWHYLHWHRQLKLASLCRRLPLWPRFNAICMQLSDYNLTSIACDKGPLVWLSQTNHSCNNIGSITSDLYLKLFSINKVSLVQVFSCSNTDQ
jgi:hypothetical protein